MRSLHSAIAVVFVMAMFALAVCAQDVPKTIHGGILNGKAISLPKPDYPQEAKNARVEGMVRVEVIIDESGNVESAKAQKNEDDDSLASAEVSDAWAMLREAAERAATEAKFSPTFLSGKPVKVAGTITYNFSLSGKTKTISGGVLNGKAIELPSPEYPAAAKAVNASGAVAVEVTIGESGNVISAKAVSGHPLLQAAAVAAAREAKFAPTLLEGQPVKISGIITYNFVLPRIEE